MDDYRESLWGIRPEDRKWFQLFTVLGGVTGSVILAVLELDSPSGGAAPAETARNIVLGTGATFVASGFIAWGFLQVREIMSSFAAWIRSNTKKREDRLLERGREEGIELGIEQGIEQGIEKGIEQGRRQGREETLREIYGQDYVDPQGDKPALSDDADDSNGKNGNVRAS